MFIEKIKLLKQVRTSNSEVETGEYSLTKEEEYLVFYKGIDIEYSHNESLDDAANKYFIHEENIFQ